MNRSVYLNSFVCSPSIKECRVRTECHELGINGRAEFETKLGILTSQNSLRILYLLFDWVQGKMMDRAVVFRGPVPDANRLRRIYESIAEISMKTVPFPRVKMYFPLDEKTAAMIPLSLCASEIILTGITWVSSAFVSQTIKRELLPESAVRINLRSAVTSVVVIWLH